MTTLVDQTNEFIKESKRYVESYLNINTENYSFTEEPLPDNFSPTSILDVGCGNGKALSSLCQRYTCTGTGVEPSKEAVNLLNKKYASTEHLKFTQASSHQLPFDTDSFDLVVMWSALHWVGRNEYLQTLGELLRVCKKHLVIMDFIAKKDYRTLYSHDERLYTYKMDFEPIIMASGIANKISSSCWWVDPKSGVKTAISEQDINTFKHNPLNYYARKMVIFEKQYAYLETYPEEYFIPTSKTE